MKKGIISYGEAFVDYIARNSNNHHFEAFLGGTTINVAVGVQRLGTPSYYLCVLGNDKVSDFIKKELQYEDVDITYSVESTKKQICSVYVYLTESGERYFHSYVNETPDEQLLETHLNEDLFKTSAIFYYGSGTLFHPLSKKTTEKAIEFAKKYGTLIAFDPNIRLKRWENEEICRETILQQLDSVDILKISEEELLFLTKTTKVEKAIKTLTSSYSIPYVWVTFSERGSMVIHGQMAIHVPTEKIQVVDTTGAGDAFMASILHCIHSEGLPKNEESLMKFTTYANKLGSLTTTKQGALTAFPSKK